MPKGRKRTQEDYEREMVEAAKRMKKYPEYLKSARDSEEWLNFLEDTGITTIHSDGGKEFWENVRDKVNEAEIGFTTRRLIETRVTAKPRVSSKGKEWVQFRSNETGQFVSRKYIEEN